VAEEFEGLDSQYRDKSVEWLYLCFKVLQRVYGRQRMPRIAMNALLDKIEEIQEKVGPEDVEEFCETEDDPLLSYVVDLVYHLEEEDFKESVFEDEEEEDDLEELEETYEEEYEDYLMEDHREEEGDEEYVMFREMYDEREHGEFEEEELSDHEYAQYVLFLITKTVLDILREKLK